MGRRPSCKSKGSKKRGRPKTSHRKTKPRLKKMSSARKSNSQKRCSGKSKPKHKPQSSSKRSTKGKGSSKRSRNSKSSKGCRRAHRLTGVKQIRTQRPIQRKSRVTWCDDSMRINWFFECLPADRAGLSRNYQLRLLSK